MAKAGRRGAAQGGDEAVPATVRAPAVFALPSRDAQAGERRRQLLRIASDILEQDGVDAVTLPRVTARAGCARTLVYRYFASREELLLGVLRDYFERLDARLPEAEQRAAIAALAATPSKVDLAAVRELVALFWDVQVAAGLGGAILRTTPRLNPQTEALVEESRRTHERRITDPLRAAGLDEVEARVAIESMIASFVGLALRWRAGEVDRDAAIDVQARATMGLMRGLLAQRAGRRRKARRTKQPSPRRRSRKQGAPALVR